MNDLPLLSVIVPVYKVEQYLAYCVRSILAQSYGNLEVILVDDGSPDNSGAICDDLAAQDSRVRVIHQANAGGGAARNAALDIARGALIAFVDSDDYIAPDLYEHLYGLLSQGADIAECGYLEVSGDGAAFPEGEGSAAVYTPLDAMSAHIADTHFRQIIWNKLYRREMVADTRFPVGSKIDDEYFTYQLLGRAKRLIRSDKIGYAYRQQPESVMHQGFSVRQVEALAAKRQRLAWLRENMPSLVHQAQEELILNCIYCAQDTIRYLSGGEAARARQLIRENMAAALPFTPAKEASLMRKLLLAVANKDLYLAARLLNFLIDIHLLT